MLIDWFTVGAQALNFLVLVWLMKRFLYKPILHAIDEREKRIAAELADADSKRADAKKEQAELQHKNAEFDGERAALVAKATAQAEAEGKRLLSAARDAADAVTAKRDKVLQRDARALREALTRRTQDVVFQITRKALGDLASASLEERLGEVFTRRLAEMNEETKQQLSRALAKTSEPAIVRSAFELPVSEQAVVQNALNVTFSADVPVRFEVAPKVISGIEMSCGGLKVGWSIEEYLSSLEHDLADLVDASAKAAPARAGPEAPPEQDADAAPKVETEPPGEDTVAPPTRAAASKAEPATRGV